MRDVRSAGVALVAAIAIVSGAASVASGAAVPGQRGYEIVSPPERHAGDVMAHPARTRAAVDGNAIVFSSLTSFIDAHGQNIVAEYVSQRDARSGTNGWASHAIMPKLDPFSVNNVSVAGYNTTYVGEFSDDLSQGVLRTGTNLSGDPNLGTIANLYLRTDVLRPGAGSYLTVTSCAVCVTPFTQAQQTGFAGFADATPDFGHIIFESRLNLVSEASGNTMKLYEWDHGTVRLAGILPDALGGGMAPASVAGTGVRAISNYTLRTISDDGRRIFFTDNSSSLGRTGQLYMRLDHTSTVQIDASELTGCGGPPPCPGSTTSRFETASADGTKVFFTSSDSLTDSDTNGGPDLYMYDATLPEDDPHNLTQISLDSNGSDLAGMTTAVLGASSDGSYVYFFHGSQLVPGEPAVDNGHDGVYVWHDGELRYIDTLVGGSFDQEPNSLGTSFGLSLLRSRASPDGRHLLYSVQPDGTAATLHLYDYGSDSSTCVSCDPNDASAITDAAFTVRTSVGGSQPTSHLNHALSDDGRYVFFTTGDRLVPQDRNGKLDVYEYDSTIGRPRLISGGTQGSDAYFMDASADGQDVFFVTREQLVGWDRNEAYDLYDARVGGGLPEPAPVAPECAGDACQGALPGSPAAGSPLTSTFFSGHGNVPSTHGAKKLKKCARGKVRKRVNGRTRCVKRHHRSHRSAGGQR